MQTQFGNNVIISSESVQAILDTLIYPSRVKKTSNSLHYLMLVDQILHNPLTPKAPHQRLYILQNILVGLIQEQLFALRSSSSDTSNEGTYDEACQAIIKDSHSRSAETIMWSILNYLYVQVNLGFTTKSLAITLNVDERSIRRYRQDGLLLLTKMLWEHEIKARKTFRYQHIANQLLSETSESLYEREEHINDMLEVLASNELSVIYITGSKGIGKTAFLKHSIHAMLEVLNVDDLIWLSSPKDIESTITAIEDRFLRDKSTSIENIFSLFTCVIIIDDADALLQHPVKWNIFLERMKSAKILFSASNYVPQYKSMMSVTLEPLSISAITSLAQETYHSGVNALFVPIWRRKPAKNPFTHQ